MVSNLLLLIEHPVDFPTPKKRACFHKYNMFDNSISYKRDVIKAVCRKSNVLSQELASYRGVSK